MVLTLSSAFTLTVSASETVSGIPYIDADGVRKYANEVHIPVEVPDGTTHLAGGDYTVRWYLLRGEEPNFNLEVGIWVSPGIMTQSTAHVIIEDGADWSGRIIVNGGTTLHIYAQSTGASMGKFTAQGGQNTAGIGGAYQWAHGNITINGGVIIATGGAGGAGIGSGNMGYNAVDANGVPTAITINGGIITAHGGHDGAGIGGGAGSPGRNIFINGGTVTANGSGGGAGIGGGFYSEGGNVTITGGSISATAGDIGTPKAIGNGHGNTSTLATLTIDGTFDWKTNTANTAEGDDLASGNTTFSGTTTQIGSRDVGELRYISLAPPCSTCEFGSWTETLAATCTTDGEETETCTICGAINTRPIAALGHTAGTAATCTTDQTCVRCDYVFEEALGHSFGDWTETIPATETTEGEEKRYCTRENCEHYETQSIPVISTSIVNILETNIKIYPNPFTDILNITNADGYTLQILTQSGVFIHTQKITSTVETLNLQYLSAGIYVLLLEKGGEIKTIKFVKM